VPDLEDKKMIKKLLKLVWGNAYLEKELRNGLHLQALREKIIITF